MSYNKDRKLDFFLGTAESVKSIFETNGFIVLKVWELPNPYWPNHDPYDPEFTGHLSEVEIQQIHEFQRLRRANPWWLVHTSKGLIEIGRRKRVISIDWTWTNLRMEVTTDDVTSARTHVHAWTEEKMFTYLRRLADLLYEYKTEEKAA